MRDVSEAEREVSWGWWCHWTRTGGEGGEDSEEGPQFNLGQ